MTKHYLVLPPAAYICWQFSHQHDVNDLLRNVAPKLNYKTMTVSQEFGHHNGLELFTVTLI